MLRNFSREVKTDLVQVPIAAGSTGSKGTDHVDMSEDGGYDSVCFQAIYGTQGSTCVVTLRAQGSTSSTAWTSLGSAALSSTKGADDGWLYHDIVRPKYRYLRAYFTRSSTAGGSEFGGVFAHRYAPKKVPITQNCSRLGSTADAMVTTT
jgi:hypothetical protein